MYRLYTIASPVWRISAVLLLAVLWLLPMQGQAQPFTIGTIGTANGTTTYPAPFGDWFTQHREQYLYTAAELSAAGITNGFVITSVGFNVTSIGTSAPNQNYKVWIANTAVTSLTAWVPGFTSGNPSWNLGTATPVVGTNTFPFATNFIYTGGSIVVQVFHTNGLNNFSTNAIHETTSGLTFNGSRRAISDGSTEAQMLDDAVFGTNATSRPRIVIDGFPPTPCVGTMVGGMAVASPASFCTSGITSLSVTGATGLVSGLAYQWQSCTTGDCSPAGSGWTDIVGATSSSLGTSPTVTVTTQFRRRITCTNNASIDFSAPATFANVLGAIPYASLPYIQDFETWQDKCSLKEIPGQNWINTPSTGNLSWRRQNEGATATWANINNGFITPISGLGCARFHSAFAVANTTSGGKQGWMDVYVDLGSTFKKELRFLYRNRQQFAWASKAPGLPNEWIPLHNDQLEVQLSTDGGLTFPTTLGVFGNDTPDDVPVVNPVSPPPFGTVTIDKPTNWKKIVIKIGQVAPQAIIRFRASTGSVIPPINSSTPTDIGLDDVEVVELKPCAGIPIAGTLIVQPAKLCDPGTSYLKVVGSEDLLGGQDFTFQWQTSTDGVTWINITGATDIDYTTPVLTTEQPYYRRIITCKNGGSSNQTLGFQILQVRPTYAVVTPSLAGAYFCGFDNWIDGCQTLQIPAANWKNTPNTGILSWRNKNDAVATNPGNWLINNVPPTAGQLDPASNPATGAGTGMAQFFSRAAVGQGRLDVYVNLDATNSPAPPVPFETVLVNRKAVQFFYHNASGTDNMSVSLATNGNAANPSFGTILGTFNTPTNSPPTGNWEKKGFFIDANKRTPTGVIRFTAQSGGPPLEATNIGIDSLLVIDLPPCSIVPIAGTAAASPANFCSGIDITISVSRGSDDAAFARDDKHEFRWQVCKTGNCTPTSPDWNNIPFAQSASYQFTALAQPNQIPPGSGTIIPRQYRRKIMCPVDTINLVAYSNAVTLEFPYIMGGNGNGTTYAPIPYYQGFEDAWVTGGTCAGGATPAQALIRPVNPATVVAPNGQTYTFPDAVARTRYWRSTGANNAATWRRMNNATVSGGTGWTTTGDWTSTGRVVPIGIGAAAFNTFGARDSNEGKLDLYVNGTGTQMKQLRFRYRNPNRRTPFAAYNDDQLEVKVSFNNGEGFQDLAQLGSTGGMPTIPGTLPVVAPGEPEGWIPYVFNFNNDAPETVIRFNGKRQFSVDENNVARGSDIGLDELYINYVDDCTTATTLLGGTAGKSAAFCERPPFILYVLASSDATHYGFEFQWQVSENGGPFMDIAGETGRNLTLDGSRVGTFKRIIKCTASGATAESTTISTSFAKPFAYAPLPYTQNFDATWIDGCGVRDVPFDTPNASWKSTPFVGSNSWRRQDDGVSAGWLYTLPGAIPAPAAGAGCAVYHSFFVLSNFPGSPTAGPAVGTIDLYVNASTPGTKLLRFWYINPEMAVPLTDPANGNNDKLEVYISQDGGETFDFTPIATLGRQDNWSEFQFTFESNSGSTVIRFQGNGVVDDSDIGVDEVAVTVLSTCSAPLVGGLVKPTTSLGDPCTALKLLLYVENSSTNTMTGLTYEWESSLYDPGTLTWGAWTPIVGATAKTYEAGPVTQTKYRRKLICGTNSAYATEYVFYLASAPIFASLPYKEDFERWGDACDDQDIPFPATNKIHWRTRPYLGNNAWRNPSSNTSPQQPISDLTASGWGERTVQGWLQGGRTIPATGNGAASFHSYSAAIRTTGDLELYLNTKTLTDEVKVLEFQYSNPDYPTNIPGFTNDDYVDIFLSTDGGFTFSSLPIATLTRTKDLWETKRLVFDNLSLPFLNSDLVIIRFRATSDNGGTDIGLDNMSMRVLPKKDAGVTNIKFNRCSPIYGNVVVEVSNFGSETIQNFPVQYTIGANTFTENFPVKLEIFQKGEYQFLTPTNVAGVPSLVITAKTNLTGDSDATNDSRTVTLPVNAFAAIPYTEGFDAGIPGTWTVQAKLNTRGWSAAIENDKINPLLDNEFPQNPLQFWPFSGNGFTGTFVALDDNRGGAARTSDVDRLITPAFNLSNYSNAQFKFDAYHSNIAGGTPPNALGDFIIEYSIGNADWVQIQKIDGDGNLAGVAYSSPTITLPPAAQGRSNVRISFRYNDEGVITGGAAIDNFLLSATQINEPEAKITIPTVNRAYVNRGTNDHIVYRFNVESAKADVLLSDVILKTGVQEYKIEDFKQNSFRLYHSTDSIFGASDRLVGTTAVTPKGTNIVFSCLNYALPFVATNVPASTAYFFFTVDVADKPIATVRDSINVQIPVVANDNSSNFITVYGIRTPITLREGGYQIIADVNTPPTSENIIVEMKMKTSASDPNYTFKAADFKFKDIDTPIAGDIFRKLQITSKNLPDAFMKLQLNGVDVVNNQIISVTQIPQLVFIPRLNEAKINYASFSFKLYDGRDWSTTDYNAQINVINDKVFIPTLFSPNGDGKNDIFIIRGGEGVIDKLTFKVLDRNNNPMYESSDIVDITTKGWDGKKAGKEQPVGTYLWYIEGTYKDGKPIEVNGKKTGVIRLVR